MENYILDILFVIMAIEVIAVLDKIRSFIESRFKLEHLRGEIQKEHEKQQRYLEENTPDLTKQISSLESELTILRKSNEGIMSTSLEYVQKASAMVANAEDMFFILCDKVHFLSEMVQNPENSEQQIQDYLGYLIRDINSEKKRMEQERIQRQERANRMAKNMEQPRSHDWGIGYDR